jgi:hypothetical protein
MKALYRLPLVVVLLTTTAACATLRPEIQIAELDDDEVAYVCPMHADFTSHVPGDCAKCGMALVIGKPFDMRDFGLEVTANPEVPKAGEKVALNFRVVHPGTGELVTDFELVHEMPYHLFVISQDMEFFQHIHPTAGAPGTWSIDVVLPKPGFYALVSDFAPKGASSQMTVRPLITADAGEDLLAQTAHLVIDENRTSTVGPLTGTVSFDPPLLVAGRHGHVIFTLTRTDTGEPLRDLQAYLGAFGHLFVMDEDMTNYVHSHPVETPSPLLDLAVVRGGPTVMFEGLMPKPGRYRAWAQFKYRDDIVTFATTFDVVDIGEQR